MKKFCLGSALLVCALGFAATGSAGRYSDQVLSLNPTFYFQLNEPASEAAGGALDVISNERFGSYKGDYDVDRGDGLGELGVSGPDFLIEGGRWRTSESWSERGNPIALAGLDADNTSHASNDVAQVVLGPNEGFGAPAMTVAMFVRGGPTEGGDRLFTNNLFDPMLSFQIVTGLDGLVVATNPQVGCSSEFECGHRVLSMPQEGVRFSNRGADHGLLSADNGWWHIVVATEGVTPLERTQNIRLWLNGVNRSKDMLPGQNYGYGVNTTLAKIGGRWHDNTHPTTHSGAQDEVSIWLDRVLTNEEALSLYEAAISSGGTIEVPGDFDGDGQLTALDIDLLSDAVLAGDNPSQFDLNDDSVVNQSDRDVWVNDLKFTYYGDADFDGEFNTTDFVAAFVGGKYEDGIAANAGWASGDWNGDKEFDTTDFITAFVDGGYEIGPRQVAVVPEPSSLLLFAIGLWVCLPRRR